MGEIMRVNLNMDRDMWNRFREICRKRDLTAAQVIRKFVRDTIQTEPDPKFTEAGKE